MKVFRHNHLSSFLKWLSWQTGLVRMDSPDQSSHPVNEHRTWITWTKSYVFLNKIKFNLCRKKHVEW